MELLKYSLAAQYRIRTKKLFPGLDNTHLKLNAVIRATVHADRRRGFACARRHPEMSIEQLQLNCRCRCPWCSLRSGFSRRRRRRPGRREWCDLVVCVWSFSLSRHGCMAQLAQSGRSGLPTCTEGHAQPCGHLKELHTASLSASVCIRVFHMRGCFCSTTCLGCMFWRCTHMFMRCIRVRGSVSTMLQDHVAACRPWQCGSSIGCVPPPPHSQQPSLYGSGAVALLNCIDPLTCVA